MAKEQLAESLEVAIKNFQKQIEGFIEAEHDESNLIDPMNQLAKQLLYGGYIHVISPSVNRKIYLHAVEFYYHEGKQVPEDSRITDYVMYHIPDFVVPDGERGALTPVQREIHEWNEQLFPVGTLVGHTSGVDLTFEDSNDRYRAAVLLREFVVVEDDNYNGAYLDRRSTFVKDELFHGLSVFDSNGPLSIQWQDVPMSEPYDILCKVRTGIKKVDLDKTKKSLVRSKKSDERKWHFKKETNTLFSKTKAELVGLHPELKKALENDAVAILNREFKSGEKFDSHQFIEAFTQCHQTEYVSALHEENVIKHHPDPFRKVHVGIARFLKTLKAEVKDLKDTDVSLDVFKNDGTNHRWEKI